MSTCILFIQGYNSSCFKKAIIVRVANMTNIEILLKTVPFWTVDVDVTAPVLATCKIISLINAFQDNVGCMMWSPLCRF